VVLTVGTRTTVLEVKKFFNLCGKNFLYSSGKNLSWIFLRSDESKVVNKEGIFVK
jgi:hypothetical protein